MIKLQEISGYLPYKLKMWDEYNQKLGILFGLDEINITILHIITWSFHYNEVKPILRPLSDLTKEIEVNGEKFIPVVELCKMDLPEVCNIEFLEHDKVEEMFLFQYQSKEGYPFMQIGINSNPQEMPFKYIQKLYEWKFDIFGLIERGDAININTLKL